MIPSGLFSVLPEWNPIGSGMYTDRDAVLKKKAGEQVGGSAEKIVIDHGRTMRHLGKDYKKALAET